MSLDQESAAGTVSAPKGRWGEYTLLSRQIKQAGLLERRRGWYGAKIGLNLALLAAGCCLRRLGNPGAAASPPPTGGVFTVRFGVATRRQPPAVPFPGPRPGRLPTQPPVGEHDGG